MAEDEEEDKQTKSVKTAKSSEEPTDDDDFPAVIDPFNTGSRKFVAYTVKLPVEQLAALQSIWLELKKLYGSNSPDKSGMIQQATADWLKRWDGPERKQLLQDLLEIRQDTRRRQYRKSL